MPSLEPSILAVETSSEHCSVALLYSKKCLVRAATAIRDHTQVVLQFIDELLNEAHLSLNQLDIIAFGEGPGSFTGLRVAAAVVQGLSLGAQVPVLKISSLRALAFQAYQQTQKTTVWVGVDARQGEMYLAAYAFDSLQGMRAMLPETCILPSALPIEQIQAVESLCVGNAWKTYGLSLPGIPFNPGEAEIFPRAQEVAQLALLDLQAGVKGVCPEQAMPVYLQTFRLGNR